MEEEIKSGQEILNDFFANVESLGNVDAEISKMIKTLFENDQLTDTKLKNELAQLRTQRMEDEN